MRLTQAELDAIAKGDHETLRKIEATVKKCARIGARMLGAEHIADDICQELWIVFIAKLLPKFDACYALEPILIESAKLITMNVLRKQGRGKLLFMENAALIDVSDEAGGHSSRMSKDWGVAIPKPHVDLDESGAEKRKSWDNDADGITNAMSGFSAHAQVSETDDGSWTAGLNQAIDQQKYLDKVLRTCPELTNVTVPQRKRKGARIKTLKGESEMRQSVGFKTPKSSIGAAPAAAMGLLDEKIIASPHVFNLVDPALVFGKVDGSRVSYVDTQAEDPSQRLRAIREALHLTQSEMAVELNLKQSTYLSYEYKRVQTVPRSVQEDAERLLALQGKDNKRNAWYAKFANMSMKEIAYDWAKRLDVEPTNVTQFANRLGVNKSTVSRWIRNEQQPDLREIIIYECDIQEIERRQEKRTVSAVQDTGSARRARSKLS